MEDEYCRTDDHDERVVCCDDVASWSAVCFVIIEMRDEINNEFD